jgi:hypothetical protein
MRILRVAATAGAMTLLAGCFHQVVDTGLPRSTTTVKKSFHPTFLFGLVAGSPIDVRQQCPSGIAVASTRQSFANGVVGMLTLGIFTPHEVSITCASGGRADAGTVMRVIAATNDPEAFNTALSEIARESAVSGRPIVVTFAPETAPSR